MSQEQDSGLEQKNEGKKKRRKKEDKDLELHSVGALPDVLTALDACLQEEMGKEGSSGIQAQELLSRMTRACQTGHHDESPQHTLSTTKIVAFGKSGHEADQKGHGEHLTNSHVEKSSGPMDSVVFLRAEAIPEHELKALSIAQFVGQVLAVALLIVEIAFKFAATDRGYIHSKVTEWCNVAASGICLLAILALTGNFCKQVWEYRHRKWGRRRQYLCILTLAEACIMILNCFVMLLPNAYILVNDCEWFSTLARVSAFLKWSCWNALFMIFLIHARNANFWFKKGKALRAHGRDRLQLDAPLWHHWPIMIHWLIFELINVALLVTNSTAYDERFKQAQASGDFCAKFNYDCHYKPATLGLQILLFSSWLVWIMLWVIYVYKALSQLHLRPWHRYRMANTNLRIQVKSRANSLIVFFISVPLLVFVKINSCATYVQTYLGLGPMVIVETVAVLFNLYYYAPKTPAILEPMLQVMLQDFAWSEAQKDDKLALRNKTLNALGFDASDQPIFCFETTIKAFYFAALIYEYEEEKAASMAKRKENEPTIQGYTLSQGMELYNLERFELLVEPKEDTKVLLSWNSDTIVLSFRGTASMTNVIADLQVWMSPHPPKRGTRFWRPEVHAGFLKAWMTNRLNERVLNRMRSILKTPGVDVENMRIGFTGHSLGGALANLAAFDCAREFKDILKPDQIHCTTFGAPRAGNYSYAYEYNQMVPNTWSIINARDIIPRSGKFIHKYKRPGLRVVITKIGDMLVRPSFVEFSATQSLPFQSSVQEHYLTSYKDSLLAICAAQFGKKGFKDGVEGMGSLIGSGEVNDVLASQFKNEGKQKKKGGKRQKILESLGGFAVFQLTANVQRELNKGREIFQSSKDLTAYEGSQPKDSNFKRGSLRCHDGICWREGEEAHDTDQISGSNGKASEHQRSISKDLDRTLKEKRPPDAVSFRFNSPRRLYASNNLEPNHDDKEKDQKQVERRENNNKHQTEIERLSCSREQSQAPEKMGKNIGSIRKHRKSQNANQSNQDVSNLDKDLEKGEYEDSDEDFEAEPIYRQLERFSATLAPTTAEQNHQGSDQLPPGNSEEGILDNRMGKDVDEEQDLGHECLDKDVKTELKQRKTWHDLIPKHQTRPKHPTMDLKIGEDKGFDMHRLQSKDSTFSAEHKGKESSSHTRKNPKQLSDEDRALKQSRSHTHYHDRLNAQQSRARDTENHERENDSTKRGTVPSENDTSRDFKENLQKSRNDNAYYRHQESGKQGSGLQKNSEPGSPSSDASRESMSHDAAAAFQLLESLGYR